MLLDERIQKALKLNQAGSAISIPMPRYVNMHENKKKKAT